MNLTESVQTPEPTLAAKAAQTVTEARIQPIPRTSAITFEIANDYLIWSYVESRGGKAPACGVLIDSRMYEPATALSYIERLTRLNSDRRCKVSLYLSLSDAILRSFFVPVVPKNELTQMALWEAGKVFPFQPEPELFEWKVIDTLEWSGVKKHQIQAAAIPPARIQPITEYFIEHFQLATLTLTSLAWEPQLIGLATKNPIIANKSVAIVRLFGSRLSVLCFNKGSLEFIRENDLESMVTGDEFETSLSILQDGEVHKRDFNTYRGFNCEAMARLVAEELDYYYGRFSQRSVELLLLALPAELEEASRAALGEVLGMPVQSLTAGQIQNNRLEPACAHMLVPAVLKNPSRIKPLDLLPRHYREILRENKLFKLSAMVGCVAILLVGILVAAQIVEVRQADATRVKMEQTLQELQESDAYKGVALMQTQGAAWQSQLSQLRGTYIAHSQFLRMLSQFTPESVFLSGMQLQTVQSEKGIQVAAVAMSGFVSSAEQYPEVVLSKYIKALQTQPGIDKLRLQNQLMESVNADRRLRFTLVLEVKS
ncbi:MAG: hypothetical protein WBP42_11685 [Candidatus Zixiibacteriota bacterium]